MGRAAHFAGDENQHVVQQGREPQVQSGKQVVLHDPLEARVHVPASADISSDGQVPRDGRESRSGFDHPPSHQKRLAEQVATEKIARGLFLAANVERLGDLGRRQEVDRPLAQSAEVSCRGMLMSSIVFWNSGDLPLWLNGSYRRK
jgi:hypothetical protein